MLEGRVCRDFFFHRKERHGIQFLGTVLEITIFTDAISWKTTDITYGESKMLSTLAGHR